MVSDLTVKHHFVYSLKSGAFAPDRFGYFCLFFRIILRSEITQSYSPVLMTDPQ